MTRLYKDLGSAFDSLRSESDGGRGGGGEKRRMAVRKKRRREEKRRGDWGKKEGNACYSNPALFTSADAGVRKFLLR